MRRTIGFKILFLIIASICAFQLLGIGEALCDDSPLDVSCHGCLACPGHFVAALAEPDLIAHFYEATPAFADYKFTYVQRPFSTFLRPPIAR